MSEKTWPYRMPLFLDDTRWAIAGKVPVAALEAARHEISDWIPLEGSKVVVGDDGFAALLFFGGSADAGDTLSMELARDNKTPVYLLEFNDEAPYIKEFDGARERWKRGYPAEFLGLRGVIAPGYEPRLPPPVRVVGVVDGITPEQAGKAVSIAPAQYVANARGVLVPPGVSAPVANRLSRKLKRRCFTVFYNFETGKFSCVVLEPGKPSGCFSLGANSRNYEPLDSILGETTLEGVLRVLDIPRHLLFPDDPSAGSDAGGGEQPP